MRKDLNRGQKGHHILVYLYERGLKRERTGEKQLFREVFLKVHIGLRIF